MQRKYSPQHDKWHRIVEGQIRHTIGKHPKWFVFKDEVDKKTCINSLAKRIVGEIVAAGSVATVSQNMFVTCDSVDKEECGNDLHSLRKGVAINCSSSFKNLVQRLFK